MGEKNHQWKGDYVGYISLHEWVKNHKEHKSLCEDCNQEKRLDLANKSGLYKRDIEDWEWLCRRCHMIKDGRLESLTKDNKEKSAGLLRDNNGRFIPKDKVIS